MRGSKAKALRRRIFGDRAWNVERSYRVNTKTGVVILAPGPHKDYRQAKRGTVR
jgi:hypothetical protein